MNTPLSLIGAPTDIGAGSRGASMGPEALRVAHLASVLQGQGLEVIDRGNLAGPTNPWRPPVDGYRHLAEVVAWNRTVHDAVLIELRQQRLPVLLGGDHALAIGSISAVARHCREQGQRLRVLWLDAHADFNTHLLTPSGNLHGMPMACLCGHGPQELIELGGQTPAINPEWVRQIGIRSVDAGEKRFVHEQELEVFDMRYIDEVGMKAVLRFPSFGELSELGGPGPSLDRLYAEGNKYIESNSSWSTMAKSQAVRVHEGVAGVSYGHAAAAAVGPRPPLSEGGAGTMQRRAVHARSPVTA